MNVRARPLDSPIRADASRQVRAPVRVRAAAVGDAVVTERARAAVTSSLLKLAGTQQFFKSD